MSTHRVCQHTSTHRVTVLPAAKSAMVREVSTNAVLETECHSVDSIVAEVLWRAFVASAILSSINRCRL